MGLVGLRLDLMTDHPPSVLWHCWLGHMTCKNIVPEWPILYTVSSGTLNLTLLLHSQEIQHALPTEIMTMIKSHLWATDIHISEGEDKTEKVHQQIYSDTVYICSITVWLLFVDYYCPGTKLWGAGAPAPKTNVLFPDLCHVTRAPLCQYVPSHAVVWTDTIFGLHGHVSLAQNLPKCFCGRGSARNPLEKLIVLRNLVALLGSHILAERRGG